MATPRLDTKLIHALQHKANNLRQLIGCGIFTNDKALMDVCGHLIMVLGMKMGAEEVVRQNMQGGSRAKDVDLTGLLG